MRDDEKGNTTPRFQQIKSGKEVQKREREKDNPLSSEALFSYNGVFVYLNKKTTCFSGKKKNILTHIIGCFQVDVFLDETFDLVIPHDGNGVWLSVHHDHLTD